MKWGLLFNSTHRHSNRNLLYLARRFPLNAVTRNQSSLSHHLSYNRDTGVISTSVPDEDTSSSGGSSTLRPIYRSVIGIEIHAQLQVPTKLFSSGLAKHHPHLQQSSPNGINDMPPNSAVASHDIAYPGTLPLISKSAVQSAVLSAAALNCFIPYKSRFERKHYAYADLPFGYQVTQQRWPLAKEGFLTCRRYAPPEAKKKKKGKKHKGGGNVDNPEEDVGSKFFQVGIDRIQLEQDTGKTTAVSISQPSSGKKQIQYLIDFNRAGSALIEVVFRPQIHAAHEAASVVSTLQSLLKYLGTCDGKMEEGSLRCDLNVSIAPIEDNNAFHDTGDEDNPFQSFLPKGVGQRVEVKNLNSIKQVIQSAEYEALRQASLVVDGGKPTQRETRTFDPRQNITIKIRDKDGAVDYRFMPEPDLPPLCLSKETLDFDNLEQFLEAKLPELPEAALVRLMNQYGIAEASSLILTSDRPAISFFEDAVRLSINEQELEGKTIDEETKKQVPVVISNWLCNDLFALIKESATAKDDSPIGGDTVEGHSSLNHPISVKYSLVDAVRFSSLITLIMRGIVSTTQAKKLLQVMYKDDHESLPMSIAEANGWKLITDPSKLRELCRNVVTNEKQSKQLDQYRKGGKHVQKMIKFFKGKVMAESKGNAHPEGMAQALQDVLEEIAPGVEE